jgi:hypothetical protein
MEATEALATNPKKKQSRIPTEETAPAAAAWLFNPEPDKEELTPAQRWAAEPQWEGPDDYGDD